MILRTTLVTLASFSIRCQQSVGVTCYPQVCFGSVTMWHARSLKPVSPSGQRCLVTPGWNLPLQVWPVPYQRGVLVHEWVRSAIHSSPQLTSPMVSYLWNFWHRLVRYYWYKNWWEVELSPPKTGTTCNVLFLTNQGISQDVESGTLTWLPGK